MISPVLGSFVTHRLTALTTPTTTYLHNFNLARLAFLTSPPIDDCARYFTILEHSKDVYLHQVHKLLRALVHETRQ